jgi:ribosomal protein RSM22 (predicted rRNA methylase)
MAAAGDWCHFAQRVERTSRHRQLKGGTLGYEDEKFSYLVASRKPSETVPPRILRHPGKHSGHVQLELCMPDGHAERRTITRSNKQAYRLARKATWGDAWDDANGDVAEKE